MPTGFNTPSFGTATGGLAGGFGAPNTNLSFGVPAQQNNPGLTIGTPASTANAGLTFGTPATSNPNTGFGIASTTPQTQNMAFGATNTGFSFGTTPNTTSLSFGASNIGSTYQAPKPGLLFGTAATSQAPASTGTFGLGTAAVPATTQATGFSFGTSTATTNASTPSLGLNFGTTMTSTPNLSFGLGSALQTTATSVVSSAAPVGLGGIATLTPSTAASDQSKTEQAAKDQHLPNELQLTVDNFKNFVKQQKTFSSDIARYSLKEFRKVEEDISIVTSLLNEVEKQLQTNKNTAEKLKYDTARGLQQVEIAQRTFDTPIGLQYENTAPLNFFIELVEQFGRDMQNLKSQIESTDKYVKTHGKSVPLTSQDLCGGMRRIHETFVSLAGHLQTVHSQVEAQKEEYLNYRKHNLNDGTNVFDSFKSQMNAIDRILSFTVNQPPILASGPTPFGNISHPSVIQQQAATQNNPPTYQQASSTFGGLWSSLGTIQQGTSLFGGSTTFNQGSNAFGTGTSSFALQKPPTGAKRGKQ